MSGYGTCMMAANKECLLSAQLWYQCVHDCTQECLLVSGYGTGMCMIAIRSVC